MGEYKSALKGEVSGPEMPPFKGYLGSGPSPHQVLHDLRQQLKLLNRQLRDARERIEQLKAQVRYLGSGGGYV